MFVKVSLSLLCFTFKEHAYFNSTTTCSLKTTISTTVSVYQGPVVQSIVSLTTSLRRQLVKYMPTALLKTLIFFVEKKCENILHAKGSHIFSNKNITAYLKCMEIKRFNETLTNVVVNFEQPAPDVTHHPLSHSD